MFCAAGEKKDQWDRIREESKKGEAPPAEPDEPTPANLLAQSMPDFMKAADLWELVVREVGCLADSSDCSADPMC